MDIFNLIKTQHTYKNVDNHGAHYTMTVTIESNDRYVHPNYVMKKDFYVLSEHMPLTFNPMYYYTPAILSRDFADAPSNVLGDIIVVKGQIGTVSNVWEMSSVVSEHFKGSDPFKAAKALPNVTSVYFEWAANYSDVTPGRTPQYADFTVDLIDEMTEKYLVRNMDYTTTLVNSEKCPFSYSILFVNPFVGVDMAGVKIFGNDPAEVSVDLATQVLVQDKNGSVIYSYDKASGALVLSSTATGTYHLSDAIVSVDYEFDANNADYKEIMANMSSGSKFDLVTDNAGKKTGEIVWLNQGATLARDYTVTVIATISFEDLSQVKCHIPVTLSRTK